MPRTWLILLLAIVGVWGFKASLRSRHHGTPLPERGLPDGFTASDAGDGSGRVLTVSFPQASSATEASRAAMRALASYFDEPVRVRTAVSDDSDSQAQVFFDAQLGGSPVAGVLMASVSGEGPTVRLLYDRPQSLRSALTQLAEGGSRPPRGPVERPVNWQTANFPDGSGTIDLPEGWVLEGAEQGEVHAHGPNGEYLSLGRPNYVQEYALPGSAGITILPYIADPLEALVEFEHQLGVEVRVLDRQYDSSSNVGLALYDYTVNGTSYRAFGYFQTQRTPGGGSWIFYTSYVSAPADRFSGTFRTLLDAWKSYRISGRLMSERIASAAESMREAGEILRASNANTSETYRRTNYAWQLCRREQDLIEDTWDHDRGTVDTIDAHHLVDELNRQDGSTRWRVVPLGEY